MIGYRLPRKHTRGAATKRSVLKKGNDGVSFLILLTFFAVYLLERTFLLIESLCLAYTSFLFKLPHTDTSSQRKSRQMNANECVWLYPLGNITFDLKLR